MDKTANGKPMDSKLLPVQFAALTGAQAAASHAIKKYWKEEEDAYTAYVGNTCLRHCIGRLVAGTQS